MTYDCLNHIRATSPHAASERVHIDLILGLSLIEQRVKCYVCTRPPNPSTDTTAYITQFMHNTQYSIVAVLLHTWCQAMSARFPHKLETWISGQLWRWNWSGINAPPDTI